MTNLEIVEIVHGLAHPLRLHLAELIYRSPAPMTVTELIIATGKRAPTVSASLAVLRTAGVLRAVRQHRNVLYTLRSNGAGEIVSALLRVQDL